MGLARGEEVSVHKKHNYVIPMYTFKCSTLIYFYVYRIKGKTNKKYYNTGTFIK